MTLTHRAPLKGSFVDMKVTPMRRVIDEVSLSTGIRVEDILSPKRDRPIVRARQMAMLICRDYCAATYPEIGRVFKRDHTTVVYSVNRATEICADADWDDMEAIARRADVAKGAV